VDGWLWIGGRTYLDIVPGCITKLGNAANVRGIPDIRWCMCKYIWGNGSLPLPTTSKSSYVIKDLAKSGEILSSQQSPFLSGCIHIQRNGAQWNEIWARGFPQLTWPSELSAKNVFGDEMVRKGGLELTERKYNGHLNDRTTQHSAGQKLAATYNQCWSALPVTMDLFHGLFADRQSDEHG